MSTRWKVAEEAMTAKDTIWQDPSSYNPFEHGPSYLPSKTASLSTEVLSATGFSTPTDSMPSLLVFLRALAMIHQTNHWVTKGPSSYSDHLLFQRLYDGVIQEIDQVAEKAVGLGYPEAIGNARAQALGVQRVVTMLYPSEAGIGSDGVWVETSLRAESVFLENVETIVSNMKSGGDLSRGTDNLIAAIQDKHEEHLYLLRQRLSAGWKV